MSVLKIAVRNLARQKRRTFFTGLSMFVGFVLSCFFIGWADGAYNGIIDSFTRNRQGHIQIHQEAYLDKPSLYKTIDDPGAVEAVLAGLETVDAWAPRIYSAGLVSAGEKTAGAEVVGIDPEREDRMTRFSAKLTEGRYFPPEGEGDLRPVILGKDLAKTLKAGIGNEAVIVSQAADGSIANDIYEVIGLVDMEDPGLNRTGFYLTLHDAQELFVLPGQVHEIALTSGDLRDVEAVTGLLKGKLTGYEVDPWRVFAAEFYKAMAADMGGMYVSLLVVIIVVAITILNTVLMSVLERRREYGVLIALGTRPGAIVRMVATETVLLSALCVLAGAMVGFLLNLYFSIHGVTLAEPIIWGGVQMDRMRAEINLKSFLLPAIVVTMTSLLVCLPPALKAAKTDPALTMRMF